MSEPKPPLVYTECSIGTVERPTAHVVRVTLVGDGLAGYLPARSAEAFRLLLPPSADAPVVFPQTGSDGLPVWRADDPRPMLRGFTVVDHAPGSITFEVMDRPGSRWNDALVPGRLVGIAGMRFGYHADGMPGTHLLVGDRSALPAVRASLTGVPEDATVRIVVSGVVDDAEHALLGDHAGRTTHWLDDGDDAALRALVARERPDHVLAVGEVGLVGSVHRAAVELHGLAPERLQPIVYWQRGLSADQRDPLVYQRYQAAARRGLDVSDPRRVADLELTPFETDAARADHAPHGNPSVP